MSGESVAASPSNLSAAIQGASEPTGIVGEGESGADNGDGESRTGGISRTSFFERLLSYEDDAAQLHSPTSAQIFPLHEFIAFALHHGVETDAAVSLFRTSEYTSLVKDGLLVRLLQYLKGFRRNGDPKEVDFQVPLSELHAPNVPGSHTVYTLGTGVERKGSLSVSVGGSGAGGSVTQSLKMQSEVPVRAGDCQGLVCDGKGLVTQWVKGSKSIYLVSVLDLSELAYPIRLMDYPGYQDDQHHCLAPDGFSVFEKKVRALGLRLGRDYHTAKPTTEMTTDITITGSQEYKITLGLPSPFGGSIGVEVSTRFDKTATGKFTLPGQYSYIAAMKDVDALPMTWSAQPF